MGSGEAAHLIIQQLEQLVIIKQQAFQFRMGHWLKMQPVDDVVTQRVAPVLQVRGRACGWRLQSPLQRCWPAGLRMFKASFGPHAAARGSARNTGVDRDAWTVSVD